jgi:hypothetical protein
MKKCIDASFFKKYAMALQKMYGRKCIFGYHVLDTLSKYAVASGFSDKYTYILRFKDGNVERVNTMADMIYFLYLKPISYWKKVKRIDVINKEGGEEVNESGNTGEI